MKTPPPAAAARVIDGIVNTPARATTVKLSGPAIMEELQDLAQRLARIDTPRVRAVLELTPRQVVKNHRRLGRATGILSHTPHRLQVVLRGPSGVSPELLWAIIFLQQAKGHGGEAMDFTFRARLPQAIRRHFGLAADGGASYSQQSRLLWRLVLGHCRREPRRQMNRQLEQLLKLENVGRHPLLILPDSPRCWLELAATGQVGRNFHYEINRRGQADDRLAKVPAAGTIHIKAGRIAFHRGRRVACSFFLDAWLYWPRQCWDAGIWIPCAVRALAGDGSIAQQAGGRAGAGSQVPTPPAATLRLGETLQKLFSDLPPGTPFRLQQATPSLGNYVELELVHTQDTNQSLIVLVEPRQGAQHFATTVGDLALSFSSKTPLDSSFRRRAMKIFLRLLEMKWTRRVAT